MELIKMKVKKGQIIFLVVIFLIIVSKINCVFADSVTCIDVSKDDYEFNADLRYGGFPFEKVAGLLTDESFPQVYDFIVNGVDTDKIKKCKQEDVYKNLIDSTLEKMDQIQKADTAGPAGGGGGYSIIDYFNSQGTSLEKEKEKLNNILNEIGASSQDKDKNAARYDDVNNLDEASKSTDKEGVLIGIVLLDDIRNIMFRQELYHRFTVGKLMTSAPARLYDTDSMEQVMRTFDDTKAWNLPVVDAENKYLGFVSKSKIFNSYREVLVHFSED